MKTTVTRWLLGLAIVIFACDTVRALPVLYCGQYGNAFAITWIRVNGHLTYIIQSAGGCTDGPYTLNDFVRSDQEGTLDGVSEASTGEYDKYKYMDLSAAQNDSVTADYDSALALAPSLVNTTFNYVNPEKVSLEWSEQLAKNEGKSIYALTLSTQPFQGVIKFNIWSDHKQDVTVQLIDVSTGLPVFQASLSVIEGKNEKEKVYYSNLKGTYLLTITSDINVISRTVSLQ